MHVRPRGAQDFCATCEKKKHENLEAHEETPTVFATLQRRSPDQYQPICTEPRLLTISIFFISSIKSCRGQTNRAIDVEILSISDGTGPAPDPRVTWCSDGVCSCLGELWNTNEPVRLQYLQSHGQQLVLDVSTPPLLHPEETVLSICLT